MMRPRIDQFRPDDESDNGFYMLGMSLLFAVHGAVWFTVGWFARGWF